MSITRKQESRALSAEERELIVRTHHPAVQDETDEALASLQRLVRERRDRASDQARRRRREMRGKAAPRGATPSTADEGSQMKLAVLAAAVRRLNNERERRRRMANQLSLVENARKALALKQDGQGEPRPNTRHARYGMRNAPNQRPEDLVRPMERGRQRKAAAVAQAIRDAR